MDLFKRLGLPVASRVLTVGGVVLVFAGLGGSAFALDIVFSPEIDPGAITGAMTLLIGSAMLITGKCVRK